MDAEALYARMPVALQHWAVTFEGWRLHSRRYDAEFRKLLREYRERDEWPVRQALEFRNRRLTEFVGHAAATVPYYRRWFREERLDPRDIRSLEDLARLPVLSRQTVQGVSETLASENPRPASTLICHTSGSTGTGLRFPATWRAHREQYAVWWRYRGWYGLEPGTPCLYMGGRSVVPLDQKRPPYWRYNRGGRQILFSAYHLNEDTARDYLGEMRRSGIRWLHGYPSMVALVATHSLQTGIPLALHWVTLGSENVLRQQASLIREAFGVEPHEHYGMAEAVANISRCPDGRLHVDEDFAAVELLHAAGDQYRIIGTNVSNAAFPLLRYDTGDLATLTGLSCPCGRPGRVVDSVDGRREDYVITRSGVRLGRLDHIFKDLVNVREAQIRQSEPGRMTLCIVRGPGYGEEDERQLRRETAKRVGREIDFNVEYVQALPRTRRGKLRFVVSTVAVGRLPASAQRRAGHPDQSRR